MAKAFSQACENNKYPIYSVLDHYLTAPGTLLEIGSGTGQHAAYLAPRFPNIRWQPTDLEENLPSINAWRAEVDSTNLLPPQVINASIPPSGDTNYNYLFTANTLHIMSWASVQCFLQCLPQYLAPEAWVFFYGPFKYNGAFTTDSNAHFDAWLKQRAAHQGIRDFEAIKAIADSVGLRFKDDVNMPANNQMLIWQYIPSISQ